MSRNWTPAQSAAINTRGKDLLVSAAAGSGKTATLTERIIRSLTDKESPSDISEMLVVTFTRAAASELRQKIFSAVSDALADDPSNRHLQSQLVKVGNADICTIDAFYLDIIRENFSALGLPPTFGIADTAEADVLAKETMIETINSFYDSDVTAFSRFTEAFSGLRNSANLPDIFLDLYSKVCAYPEGVEFLKNCAEAYEKNAEADFFESSFGKILRQNTCDIIAYYISILEDAVALIADDEMASKSYLPSFAYDLSFCRDLYKLLREGTYDSVRSQLNSYSPIGLKSLRAEAATDEIKAFKAQRSNITDGIRDLAKKSFGLSADSISAAMRDSGSITQTLYLLLSEFEKRFREEKLQRGTCDFNDIKRYALSLLVAPDGSPTETARELSNKYSDIYIDEYQDVDRVQDLIFRCISNGKNRFMVGDIKQSIYGFRGAEPQVFAEYKTSFPTHATASAENSDCEAIFMSNNFRCDENIIDFTNTVCSYLFSICAEKIDYRKEDDLVFSKALPREDYESPRVELRITAPLDTEIEEYDKSSDAIRAAEAEDIAKEILHLLSNEKKADGSRISEGDIAVLYRSGNMLPHLIKAFKQHGLKFCGGDDDKYFENPDVLLLLSLLNAIDNPHRDIFLAATLQSPLFDFTLDDLIVLRRYRNDSHSLFAALQDYTADNSDNEPLRKKCLEFISALDKWRKLSLSVTVDKLLKDIYSSKRFVLCGLADSENLRVFYEYARRFESGSFKGLYNFIEYVNKLIDENTKIKTSGGSSDPNKIKLMTIHSSKGLEFPVCFVCGLGGSFNRSDSKDSLLFDHDIGIAMKLPDDTGFARINTPMRSAIASKLSADQLEEEMRILYVALTRARERLYLTASTSSAPEKILDAASMRKKYSCRYLLTKCKSFLEWILTALTDKAPHVCALEFVDASCAAIDNHIKPIPDDPDIIPDENIVHALTDRFAYRYKYSHLSRIPAKISVSRLSPAVLDYSDDSLELFEIEKAASVPTILTGNAPDSVTAAEKGTATHLFLQFCDFQRAERFGVAEEVARMVEEKYVPQNLADAMFVDELQRFFHSDLYIKIKNAKKIYREQRFNVLLPSSMFSKDVEFVDNSSEEPLAVQGVIDLVIIDSENSLCLFDYKTDRLTYAERSDDSLLKKKMQLLHAQQLSYYKLAVEKLFNRHCDVVGIYSTQAAKTVYI